MSDANMTADESYQIKRKVIEIKFREIEEGLKEMDKTQVVSPQDWGFVGNLNHVLDSLDEILEVICE